MSARPIIAALALFGLIGLSACSEPKPQNLADFDPHARFQNTVEKHAAVTTLVPGTDGDLSPTDRAVIADLASEHARRGAGVVAVAVTFDGDAVPAQTFAKQVATAFSAAGVADIAVSLKPTPGAAHPSAEISVPIWVAMVPECGQWPERVSPDYHNQNTANFGCAVTRNIGLMVANPADLERAHDTTGRSGVRSQDVLNKYGEGKATASKVENAKPAVTLSVVGTGK